MLGPNVLVVEDEILIRLRLVDEFREHGFNAWGAANAEEALTALEGGVAIDLIFSDVRMPGKIGGLASAGIVAERWPAVKIILASGHISECPASVHAFFQKPDEAAKVIEMANLLLGTERCCGERS